jgi:hypothetical protein
MKRIQRTVFLIGVFLLAANAHAGRWLTQDPLEHMERDPQPGFEITGGMMELPSSLNQQANLYLFVSNDPLSYYDPLGLKDYSSLETQMWLAQAYASATVGPVQGLRNIRNNSKGEGPYDFGWNEHANDTWCVYGKKMNADQFGNFIAGFQGAAYDANYFPPIALATVKAAGIGYHVTGRTKAPNDPWDKTGMPDINAGAKAATNFISSPIRNDNNKCGCK